MAAFPEPARIEIGVTKSKTQGRTITRTAVAFSSAPEKWGGFYPKIPQSNVRIEIKTTSGTKIPEI